MRPTSILIIIGCLAASLAAAAYLAYATVWSLALFTLLPCSLTVLGLLLALVGLKLLRLAKTRPAGRLLLLGGFCLVVQLAYFPLAMTVRDREVEQAQQFLTALIPKLEAYQRRHNEYPASPAAVLAGDEAVPRLLQLKGDLPLVYDNRQYYFQRGATYGFRFYLPDGFIGFHYEYCCGAEGAWTVTD